MIGMMRRSHIWTVGILAAMCALVVGCASTSVTAMSRDNFAEAVVYGRSVNLRPADVPKLVMARFPRSRVIKTGPFGSSVESCDGIMAGVHEVVGLRSQRFQRVERSPGEGGDLVPRESAQSAVYVMGNTRLAYREVMAAMNPRGLQCVEHAAASKNVIVKPEGTGTGVPLLNKINVTNVRLRVDGVSIEGIRTAAHETIEAVGPIGASNYYQDLWAFAAGRAVVMLTVVGSPRPFPIAEEHRLISILYSRAMRSHLSV